MPYVKVCGICEPAHAAAADVAGADMIGVVHFPHSPRHLDVAAAAHVASAAGSALVVALVVDADDATLDAFVHQVQPGALQLHGSETPERGSELAARYGLPIAKALGVASRSDLAASASYDALAVFDARPPKGADRPGGHGVPFDWSILDAAPSHYMLSGGLTPQNVGEAVRARRPYAVDVSSGVEAHGRKDPRLIAAFVARAKGETAGGSEWALEAV
ncbi:phosphoribosylanthranilate isomerase [Acuticoccus sp.]|uniref:phosphoribosylanthranilate isomerase n=1 Tax=Acuticoccus sp. TaxID=1904378 RepID=UPI003B52F097